VRPGPLITGDKNDPPAVRQSADSSGLQTLI
jgi:hypothetical protein